MECHRGHRTTLRVLLGGLALLSIARVVAALAR